MKNRNIAAIVGLTAALMGETVLAKDVALVMANARYQNLDRLRLNTGVITTLVDAYKRDGYEVLDVRNTDAEGMRDALVRFEGASRDADRVVIHFVGYYDEVGDDVRLLPLDYNKGSIVEASYGTPSLDLFYDLVEHRPGRAAVFLSLSGASLPSDLIHDHEVPQGVFAMAGPIRGSLSAVTEQFLNRDVAPGAISGAQLEKAGWVMDQPMLAATETVVEIERPATSNDSAFSRRDNRVLQEMEVWRQASRTGTEESLRGYLTAYPRGLFVKEAEARLAALVPPEIGIENALNLSRSDRRKIQSDLTLLGYDTRGVDGIFGRGSRAAIERWQREQRFRPTGYLDTAQIRLITRQAEDERDAIARREAEEKAAKEQADLAYWQRTGASGRERDLQLYLDAYPDGLFAPQARRLLEEIEEARTPAEDPVLLQRENRLGLTPQMKILAEQRLAARGLDTGRIDGQFDAKTREALRQFQASTGLRQTGYLNRETVAVLIVSAFRQ